MLADEGPMRRGGPLWAPLCSSCGVDRVVLARGARQKWAVELLICFSPGLGVVGAASVLGSDTDEANT